MNIDPFDGEDLREEMKFHDDEPFSCLGDELEAHYVENLETPIGEEYSDGFDNEG